MKENNYNKGNSMIIFTTNIKKLESLITLFFNFGVKNKNIISYFIFLSEVIHLNKYGKPICADDYYIDNGKIYGVNICKIIDNYNWSYKQPYIDENCFSESNNEIIKDIIENKKQINLRNYNIDLDKYNGKIDWETCIINNDILEDLNGLGNLTKNIIL